MTAKVRGITRVRRGRRAGVASVRAVAAIHDGGRPVRVRGCRRGEGRPRVDERPGAEGHGCRRRGKGGDNLQGLWGLHAQIDAEIEPIVATIVAYVDGDGVFAGVQRLGENRVGVLLIGCALNVDARADTVDCHLRPVVCFHRERHLGILCVRGDRDAHAVEIPRRVEAIVADLGVGKPTWLVVDPTIGAGDKSPRVPARQVSRLPVARGGIEVFDVLGNISHVAHASENGQRLRQRRADVVRERVAVVADAIAVGVRGFAGIRREDVERVDHAVTVGVRRWWWGAREGQRPSVLAVGWIVAGAGQHMAFKEQRVVKGSKARRESCRNAVFPYRPLAIRRTHHDAVIGDPGRRVPIDTRQPLERDHRTAGLIGECIVNKRWICNGAVSDDHSAIVDPVCLAPSCAGGAEASQIHNVRRVGRRGRVPFERIPRVDPVAAACGVIRSHRIIAHRNSTIVDGFDYDFAWAGIGRCEHGHRG